MKNTLKGMSATCVIAVINLKSLSPADVKIFDPKASYIDFVAKEGKQR